MRVTYALPRPELRGLVLYYSRIDLTAPGSTFAQIQQSPSASVQWAFFFGPSMLYLDPGGNWLVTPDSLVSGPHTKPQFLRWIGPSWVLGVDMLPTAARQLLAPDILRLAENVVPAGVVVEGPDDHQALHDRLRRIRSFRAQVDELDEVFARRLARRSLTDRRMADLHRVLESRPLNHNVSGLADDLGLSTRHLQRLFQQSVGMRPKSFLRVQRFRAVLWQMHTRPEATRRHWNDVAREAGYVDRSHLITEFRHMTGYTPSSYLRESRFRRQLLPPL